MFPEHSTGNFPMHSELSICGTKEMYNMEKSSLGQYKFPSWPRLVYTGYLLVK